VTRGASTNPKPTSPEAERLRAEYLEKVQEQMAAELRHELQFEIPRLQRYALQAIDRPQERFPSEKSIASTVLVTDIPLREERATAALLILEAAPYKQRALYILGSLQARERMIAAVIGAGGLTDVFGKWAEL